jgi:putative flippase GtrA
MPWTGSAAVPMRLRANKEFVRFAAIGVGGLFVDIAALWAALHLIGLNLYSGRVFSYLIAATFTWACNRSLTFASTGADGAIRQWARFVFFNAIGGIVNFAVYVLVAVKLREAYAWSVQIASLLPYLGVACGSVSGLAFNFLTSKFFVFR